MGKADDNFTSGFVFSVLKIILFKINFLGLDGFELTEKNRLI